MLDNTYIIFASDNGGCPASGGKNTPLRGSKGTLFEGGVKVDAFIHSRALESKMIGTVYGNLFHVSDWFPTILDMTKSAEFTPAGGYELDGVSHWDNLRGMVYTAPRQYVLYNYYYNPGKGAVDSNDFFKGAPGNPPAPALYITPYNTPHEDEPPGPSSMYYPLQPPPHPTTTS